MNQPGDDQPGLLTDEIVLWYIQRGLTPRAIETCYRQRTGIGELLAEKDAYGGDVRRLAERWGIKHNGERSNDR